jgi:hypothetical protein
MTCIWSPSTERAQTALTSVFGCQSLCKDKQHLSCHHMMALWLSYIAIIQCHGCYQSITWLLSYSSNIAIIQWHVSGPHPSTERAQTALTSVFGCQSLCKDKQHLSCHHMMPLLLPMVGINQYQYCYHTVAILLLYNDIHCTWSPPLLSELKPR